MHSGLVPAGGTFTRAEAIAAGYSAADVRHRVRTGRWVVVRRGVYVEPSSGSPTEATRVAAVLAVVGPGAVASHRSAARLHGLPLLAAAGPVEVTRPGACGRRGRDLWVSGRPLPEADVCTVDGLPATTDLRTALDLAHRPSFDEGIVACDALLNRRPGVAAGLAARASAAFGPGSARARRVVAFADGAAESPGESLSRVAIARAGLPVPRTQEWLGDDAVIGRVDFYWPAQRTVGEFDGRVKYGRGDDVWAEKVREDRLRDAGFEVVRWVYGEVVRDFASVAARLWAAFRRGRHRP